jgi:hypothetical protein
MILSSDRKSEMLFLSAKITTYKMIYLELFKEVLVEAGQALQA